VRILCGFKKPLAIGQNGGILAAMPLARLFLWCCSPVWYAFLIIGIPLFFFGGSSLKGNLFAEPFPFSSFQTLVVALLFSVRPETLTC